MSGAGRGGDRGAFALSFARSFAKAAGDHEVLAALDGSLPDSIPALKAALTGLLPSEHIVVYSLPRPVGGTTTAGPWRRRASAALRRAFFEWLGADLVHESDWTAWPEGSDPGSPSLGVSALVRAATFWPGDPHPGTRVDLFTPAEAGEEAAASALQAFAAAVARRRSLRPIAAPRPRLALVAPLPPEDTPGAVELAGLVPALEQYYDVEVVVDQPTVDAVPGVSDLQVRSAEWFDEHAGEYDRIVYQLADSRSHRYMLGLLRRHPGTVILRDIFLGGAIEEWARDEGRKGEFERALYASHGYGALLTLLSEGCEAVMLMYPCGGDLVRAADGVIVPTASAAHLVEQWYGVTPADDLAVVPSVAHDAHAPDGVAEQYHDVLERFAAGSTGGVYRRFIDTLGSAPDVLSSSRADLLDVATSVVENRPRRRLRQLLVDVSELAVNDFRTGVQRVSRAVLKRLIEDPPAGFRVEPVYVSPEGLRYARRYAGLLLGLPAPVAEDSLIEAGAGDHFLAVDISYAMVRSATSQLISLRDRGVRMDFVVYDMLPVLHPEWFPPEIPAPHREWLRTISAIADGLVCISNTVADELLAWLDEESPKRAWPLDVGSFGLGADVAATVPTTGGGRERADALAFVSARPTFVMVGTVEPRKGHAQTLSAFERLWASGVDCGLLIVGKEGWGVGELVTRLRLHPERGRRLLWLDGASDDVLLSVYGASTALLAASEGEGSASRSSRPPSTSCPLSPVTCRCSARWLESTRSTSWASARRILRRRSRSGSHSTRAGRRHRRAAYPASPGPNRLRSCLSASSAEAGGQAGLAILHSSRGRGVGMTTESAASEGLAARKPTRVSDFGVDLYGPVDLATGLGASARGFARGLLAADVPVHLVPTGDICGGHTSVDPAIASDGRRFPLTIEHINADTVDVFMRAHGHGLGHVVGRVAVWYWELAAFRADWITHASQYDEIWVASEFGRRAVAAMTNTPVRVVPPSIGPLPASGHRGRERFRIPGDAFAFLYVFDNASFVERKNPFCLIDAFVEQFAGDRDTCLVLKVSHAGLDPSGYQRLQDATAAHPNILLVPEMLDDEDLAALFRAADCYVSPHRSEGFGLTLAEAMLRGCPVIATDYGATTDFLTDETGYPIEFSLMEIEQDLGPYQRGHVWADPSREHLGRLLREVASDPTAARARGDAGRRFVEERYSPTSAGARMRAALEKLYAARADA